MYIETFIAKEWSNTLPLWGQNCQIVLYDFKRNDPVTICMFKFSVGIFRNENVQLKAGTKLFCCNKLPLLGVFVQFYTFLRVFPRLFDKGMFSL